AVIRIAPMIGRAVALALEAVVIGAAVIILVGIDVAAAVARDLVSGDAADQHAADRGRRASAAMAELVADDAAEDGAKARADRLPLLPFAIGAVAGPVIRARRIIVVVLTPGLAAALIRRIEIALVPVVAVDLAGPSRRRHAADDQGAERRRR